MSGQALRVLILEDEPADAELELAALAEGGFRCEPTLVDGRAAFESAFGPGRFELVIADYRLPDYTGLEALEHVRRRDALVPFVLVSGALGEERAVEALRSGATDYVLKHGLARLASAVRRALEERREHERHLATRRALELSQERLRALSRRLLEVQEEERGRLARDLHDDIGQALTALKIQLESLARAAGPVGNRILECVETTRHTLERVRQLSLSLRPLQLDDLGLVAALRSHLDRQASVAGLTTCCGTRVRATCGCACLPRMGASRSRCATTAVVSIWMGRNAAAPRARAWAWSAWRSASRLPAARSSCARRPDRGRYCWQHSRYSLAKGKGTVDSRRAC
jgi:CheY-like chemotaxis protein